ncbi:MAG: CBS domain-containing protein [Methanomicrobiales archaeon]|nr:CBS domain-containing protein [Methanomicrobiales archaeon]
MKVSEIMTRNPITVSADEPVREAAGLLRTHRIGGLPVMEGDRLAGIVTESDIIALLETGEISDDLWLPSPLEVIEVPVREFINWEKTKSALTSIGDKKVREIMSHPVITISEDAEIEDAASVMLSHKVARLPVVKNGRLTGIVARADIIRGVGGSSG